MRQCQCAEEHDLTFMWLAHNGRALATPCVRADAARPWLLLDELHLLHVAIRLLPRAIVRPRALASSFPIVTAGGLPVGGPPLAHSGLQIAVLTNSHAVTAASY